MLYKQGKGKRERVLDLNGTSRFNSMDLVLSNGDSTFHPIGDKAKILEKLEEVAAELEEDMQRTGWTGKTVTLKYKLDTYEGRLTVHIPLISIDGLPSVHQSQVFHSMDIGQERGSV